MVSPAISCAPGRSASCPDTNTSPPKRIACEYGAPWNGAGAASVRTTDFSAIGLLSASRGRLRECDAERFEDRLEHVLRVAPVHEANVDCQPCSLRELAQEAIDEIG